MGRRPAGKRTPHKKDCPFRIPDPGRHFAVLLGVVCPALFQIAEGRHPLTCPVGGVRKAGTDTSSLPAVALLASVPVFAGPTGRKAASMSACGARTLWPISRVGQGKSVSPLHWQTRHPAAFCTAYKEHAPAAFLRLQRLPAVVNSVKLCYTVFG